MQICKTFYSFKALAAQGKLILFTVGAMVIGLGLIGCHPPGQPPRAGSKSFGGAPVALQDGQNEGGTNSSGESHRPVYSHANDPRAHVVELDRNTESSSNNEQNVDLKSSLKSFEFFRFNGKDQRTRFGEKVFRADVIIAHPSSNEEEISLAFSGEFTIGDQGHLVIPQTVSQFSSDNRMRYVLEGQVRDSERGSGGEFHLIRETLEEGTNRVVSKSEVTIYYRAFLNHLEIRESEAQDLSERAKRHIEEFKNESVGWMQTFVVPGGPSYYQTDLLKVSPQKNHLNSKLNRKNDPIWEAFETTLNYEGTELTVDNPDIAPRLSKNDLDLAEILFSMSGPLLKNPMQNGDGSQSRVTVGTEKVESASLVGGGDQDDIFTFLLELPSSKSSDDQENPDSSDTRAMVALELHGPSQGQSRTMSDINPPYDRQTNYPEHQGLSSQMFLEVGDLDQLPHTKKMLDDFERATDLKIVREAFDQIVGNKNKKGVRSPETWQMFYQYYYPVKDLVKEIANYYDVAHQFVFLTIMESTFFAKNEKNGVYPYQRNIVSDYSTATGPFQFLRGTAESVDLRFHKNKIAVAPPIWDERHYFIPSLCAAMKYYKQNTRDHSIGSSGPGADSLLGILAHHLGGGGAASIAYCGGADISQREAIQCGEKALGTTREKFSSSDRNLHLTLLRDYGYTFNQIVRRNIMPTDSLNNDPIQWMASFVAYYLVNANYTKYISVPDMSQTPQFSMQDLIDTNMIPQNKAIQSAECTQAFENAYRKVFLTR